MIRLCLALLIACGLPVAAQAQMRGHGGPVRALAVSPDGRFTMSGGFDQSAILWDIGQGAAVQVLRFHDGAVNAVLALPDGRFATGGEDGRIALWRRGEGTPHRVINGHQAPVVSLALGPDGDSIASASWDGTARVTSLSGDAVRVLSGHQGNVNAVAFLPDGRPVTAGYDATLRVWPREGGDPALYQLPTPLNSVAAAPDGEIVAAGADGVVRFLDTGGTIAGAVETGATPVIALAVSPDATRVAAASIGGSVAIIDRAKRTILFTLVGPGLPVWSLAFTPDGKELVTGGADRLVRRWSMANGEHIGAVTMARPQDFLAQFKGERGAEVFQACAACHTLTPDDGNRAGPTLHGVFGRRIASLPGYNFSPALTKLDIVWNAETIAKLFEVGPSRFTPGTKMPEQVIGSAADRDALVRFLEKATR
jgi:cytochrome c